MRDTDSFSCFKCQTEILPLQGKGQINRLDTINHSGPIHHTGNGHSYYLVLWIKAAVRDVRGEVGVVDSTER